MTLLYLFIFKIILFLVYHSYILGLVRLDLYTCLGSSSVYPSDPWVNDRYCVGMVLIPYLSTIVPNMPDRGVVRDSDSFIDSYIVPLSCIGLAEQYYYSGVIAMFFIYLYNITMHGRSLVSQCLLSILALTMIMQDCIVENNLGNILVVRPNSMLMTC